MGDHTWRYTQRALRQRYLALFVPALARINADHPHGSGHGLQRARAVRRAADTCLVAAAAASTTDDDRFKPSGRLIIRRGRRSYKRRLLVLIKRRVLVLIKRRVLVLVLIKRKSRIKRLGHGSNHKNGCSNYTKALRSAYNKSPRSARLNLRYHNNDDATAIPAESELKRLQGVIFPHLGNGEAGAIKPATLLTQTAHYILALQVQVDALHALIAQAADPAAANTASCTLS